MSANWPTYTNPHTPYYGTADATILYLSVLHQTWKWTGDQSVLREHIDTTKRCLEWVDRFGVFDGDGFQEYPTRSSDGYENMGWRDSVDGVMYPDGSQVPQPMALIELQGYAFDARLRMADVFHTMCGPPRAAEQRAAAAKLRGHFEEAFWCEDIGFYAFGLDPNKQPIKSLASNVGHCLWAGLLRPDRAERVMRRFLEPDFWSGWGIRRLSALHTAYNPYSYHRGSVWPHDNAFIAHRFKRYGYTDECSRVARDIFEAAS